MNILCDILSVSYTESNPGTWKKIYFKTLSNKSFTINETHSRDEWAPDFSLDLTLIEAAFKVYVTFQ